MVKMKKSLMMLKARVLMLKARVLMLKAGPLKGLSVEIIFKLRSERQVPSLQRGTDGSSPVAVTEAVRQKRV